MTSWTENMEKKKFCPRMSKASLDIPAFMGAQAKASEYPLTRVPCQGPDCALWVDNGSISGCADAILARAALNK